MKRKLMGLLLALTLGLGGLTACGGDREDAVPPSGESEDGAVEGDD